MISTRVNTSAPDTRPSTQRPVPLVMRRDLTVERIEYQGVGYWVIKDPVALRYYRFQPEQYHVLELLDGRRSIDQIREEFHRKYPTVRLTALDVQNLISDLHRTGLCYSTRAGQATSLILADRERRQKAFWQALRNLLYIKLPGWDPERTLQAIHPYFKWMFKWWGVALCMTLVLASWALLAVHFREFYARLPGFQQFFGWPNVLYLWLVLGVTKVIHEFGHGLTCKHFGGECHQMGVLLLVFSPCLYCDVTDSWLVRNKWKRIMIGAAGMYIEIVISAFAIFGWWYSRPGLFNYLCLNTFFVSTISTVIFNANPLLRYDGYYMMSDWLEIPNLRQKADRLLRETFGWYCLGIPIKPDPFMPQSHKGWFIAYSLAASLYRWFVAFSIILFLYTFLKPYKLQSIGILLACASIVAMMSGFVINMYKMVTAPRIDPLNYFKLTVTLIVVGAVGWAVAGIPIPWNLAAPLVIEPYQVQHVFNPLPGMLKAVHVKPGDVVSAGDLLVELFDPQVEQELQRLETERRVQEAEIWLQRTLRDPAAERLAREHLETIDQQIADLRKSTEPLTIRAPIAGTVIGPPRIPEPKHSSTRSELPRWFGSPLDARNLNALIQPRTHLLSIAPNDRFQAVLFFDQADRNDIGVGQAVRIRLEHLPDEKYHAQIVEVSTRHVDYAPTLLSNKAGGDLPTMTDATGQERLHTVAYQATAFIEERSELLRAGMRGRARVTIETRSLGQWILRSIRRTLHFRL